MSEKKTPHIFSGYPTGKIIFRLAAVALVVLGVIVMINRSAQAAGTLTVEIIAGYNLVVDSNVGSPSTYAPRVATVIGKFCNTGDAALTNVYGYIGNGTTPGTYPVYDSDTTSTYPYLNGTGDYFFRHVGPTPDASRYIGTIPVGECSYQYWTIEYPACENVSGAWKEPPCTGDPLWGPSVKPEDDFSLSFDVWGTSDQSNANASRPMTMRNEISAMANKIEPNGNPAGRWFNTETDQVRVGDIITTNGVLYSLGNIRFGFDNDVDYAPDYNAWLQPISQADYDPTCFRLIRTSGQLTVTRGSGNPTMIINFSDNLYFTDLPDDNTNVRGEVFYTFLALNGPCNVSLSPYQEAASGFDNEKFNGDYGAGLPIGTLPPLVTIDKASAPSSIAVGGTTTYTISFDNNGATSAGLSLSSGGINMPLVISDTVPNGMQLAAAATYYLNAGTATIRYSIDSGATWTTTASVAVGQTSTWPASKIIIQWWLDQPLPAGSTGNYGRFKATVPSGYAGDAVIENTACIGLGDAAPFACDDDLLKVTGNNSLSGTVFQDNGPGTFGDGVYNDSVEGEIGSITITLYISTSRGWVEWGTTTSDGSGDYSFSSLPDGEYRIDVGSVQDTNPGWTNTTETSLFVDLDSGHATLDPATSDGNDFGFAPALTLDKVLIGPNPALEDQLVSYTIELDNILPGNGTATGGVCTYEYITWSSSGGTVGGTNWQLPGNAFDGSASTYASLTPTNASDGISSDTPTTPTIQSGNIVSVEVIYDIYSTNATWSNDVIKFQVYASGATCDYNAEGGCLVSQNETTTGLNAYGPGSANQGLYPVDVSNLASWTWSSFPTYRFQIYGKKGGGTGDDTLNVARIGWRITVTDTCGGDAPNTTIDPLPLDDTYDATKLEFVSAEPTQTSVSTGGSSPYTNTGLIYWNNLGPLYAGGTEIVTVTFRVKDGTYGSTITNTATVDDAYFDNGNPTNDATDSVTVTVQQSARLGDRVWNDFDGDGVQDIGELGLAGVIVTLTPATNVVIDGVTYGPSNPLTTTTDSNGNYLFIGLPNATYNVAVNTSTLPGTTFTPTVDFDNNSVNDNATNVVVSGGTVSTIGGQPCTNCELKVDFGYQVPNTIMGTIWQDYDGLDSVYTDRDTGDDGFGGVTVELYDTSNTLIATTTTNPDGSYTFSDLPNGSYYVLVVTSTLPYTSSVTWTQTVDPNATLDDRSGTISVSGGQLVKDVDFAYHQEGDYTLGGTVYADWDVDAVLDTGEPGFSGITVTLYSSSGALIATTTTDANGVYTFTGLITDTYTVVVDRSGIPSQYGQSEDYDETPGVCSTCDNQASSVTVNATYDNVTDVDFGYAPSGAGAIGDTVWKDMNGDGLQAGPQEIGIAGVTVTLQIDLNGDGNWVTVETAVTDANGKYLFDNLPDGDYRVIVDTTAENIPEGPGGYTYVPSTPVTQSATISGGNTDLDADFGFTPLAVIGDMVYWDANANGDQDLSETGIAGVEVRLYNYSGVTVIIGGVSVAPGGYISTTTADGSGSYPAGWYEFAGLPSGGASSPYTYTVQVMAGAMTQTADPDRDGWACGDLDTPAGYTACDNETTVLVYPGTIYLGADFGYQASGVIGDYVWYDSDGDGVQDDSEVGIAGLVITATNGVDTYTTTTDMDGHYTFAGLPDGTWAIIVGDYDDGTAFDLTPTISSTNAITNGVGSMGGRAVSVTLSSGIVTEIDLDQDGSADITPSQCGGCSLDLNIDFGFRDVGTRTISGHVFFDAGGSGDGVDDLITTTAPYTDTPYANIPVYLWKDGMIVGQTTTDASGAYTFTNVAADSGYTVSVDRSGLLSLMEITASPNIGENYNTVDTTSGNAYNQDFGFYANMDMGDLPEIYNQGGSSVDSQFYTLFAYEGPIHINTSLVSYSPTIYLGQVWDSEADGHPDLNAGTNFTGTVTGGDDGNASNDEDGIGFLNDWYQGATASLHITITDKDAKYTPYLVGWFDWNQDGRFGAGEMIQFGEFDASRPGGRTQVGPYTYRYTETITVTSTSRVMIYDTGGQDGDFRIYMRFRLYATQSPPPVISPVGAVENGEVEDYWQRNNGPLAVELAAFTATPAGEGIRLDWETASELDNVGFNVYRAQSASGPRVKLNASLLPAQAPGSVVGGSYTYLDKTAAPGVTYYYWLEDVDVRGTLTLHGPVSAARAGQAPNVHRVFLPFVSGHR